MATVRIRPTTGTDSFPESGENGSTLLKVIFSNLLGGIYASDHAFRVGALIARGSLLKQILNRNGAARSFAFWLIIEGDTEKV